MSGTYNFQLPDGRVVAVEGAPSPEAAKEFMDRQWPTLRRETPIRGMAASANEQFWSQLAGLPGAAEAVAAAVNSPEARDYLRSVGEGINVPNDPRTRPPELRDLISSRVVDAVKAYAGQAAGSIAGTIPATAAGAGIGFVVGGPPGAVAGARIGSMGQAGLSGVSELYKGLVEEGVDPTLAGRLAVPLGVAISRIENRYIEQALTRGLGGQVSQGTIGRLTQRIVGGREGGIRQTALGGAASEMGGEALRETTRGVVTGQANLPERLERIAEAGLVGTIAGAGVGGATRLAGGAGPSQAELQQAEAARAEQEAAATLQQAAAPAQPTVAPEAEAAAPAPAPAPEVATAPEVAPEAAPEVAPAPVPAPEPVAETAPVTGFATERGTYQINEQGLASRVETTPEGQQVATPPATALYVTPENARVLQAATEQGFDYQVVTMTPEGPQVVVPGAALTSPNNFVLITNPEGQVEGVIEPQSAPAVGLMPVELRTDEQGQVVKTLGDPITEVQQAAPQAAPEAAPAPAPTQEAPAPAPAITPEQENALWRGYKMAMGPEARNPIVQAARMETTRSGKPTFTREQFNNFVRKRMAPIPQPAKPATQVNPATVENPANPVNAEQGPDKSTPGQPTQQNPPQEWSSASDNRPEADVDVSETPNNIYSPLLGALPADPVEARRVVNKAANMSMSYLGRLFLSPQLTLSKVYEHIRPSARVLSAERHRANKFARDVIATQAEGMSKLTEEQAARVTRLREESSRLRQEAPGVANLSPEERAVFDNDVKAMGRTLDYVISSLITKYYDPASAQDIQTRRKLSDFWKRNRNKELFQISDAELQAASPEGFQLKKELEQLRNPYYMVMQGDGTHFIAAYERDANGMRKGRPVAMIPFTPLSARQKSKGRPDPEAFARQELEERGFTKGEYYITPTPIEFTRDRDAAALRDNADIFSKYISTISNIRSIKNDAEAQNILNSLMNTLDKEAALKFFRPNEGILIPITKFNDSFYMADTVPRYLSGIGKLQARMFTQDAWNRTTEPLSKVDRDYLNDLRDYSSQPQEVGLLGKLRSLNFFFFIGPALDSAFVNGFQTATSTYPLLARDSNPASAAKYVGGAFKDAVTHIADAFKLDPSQFSNAIVKVGRNGDERQALKMAADMGVFVPYNTTDIGAGRISLQKSKLKAAGVPKPDLVAKVGNVMLNIMQRPQHTAEQLNRATAFLAAYRLAKAQPGVIERANQLDGKNFSGPDAAFWYAQSRVDESQTIQGPEDRAQFLRNSQAAQLAFQFMPYVFKMTETMVMNGVNAIKRGDLPPSMRTTAALGLLYYAGATMLLAGIWGLPGAELLKEATEELIKTVWKDVVDLDQMLYEQVNGVGGKFLAELVTRGLPHAAGWFTGSTRLGLNPFQFQDITGAGLTTMLGPAASYPEQVANAMKYADRGEYWNALGAFLPRWAGNVAKGINLGFGTGDIRTPQGTTMLTHQQIADIDKQYWVPSWVRMAIGFPPPDIMDARNLYYRARELQGEPRLYAESANEKLANLRAQLLRAERSQDMAAFADARRRMDDLQKEINERNARLVASGNPENLFQYDWAGIYRKALEKVEGVTSRENIYRMGGPRTRENIRQMYETYNP